MSLAKVEQDNALPSCFSSHALNKCPFCGLFSATFFAFLRFLLVILLFKMSPKCSAGELSSVSKYKKTAMYVSYEENSFRYEL